MASNEPSDEHPVCTECGNDFAWNENADRDDPNPFCNQCAHVVAGRAVTLQRELDDMTSRVAGAADACGYKPLHNASPIERLEFGVAALNRNLEGEIAEHQRHHETEERLQRELDEARAELTRLSAHQYQAAIEALRERARLDEEAAHHPYTELHHHVRLLKLTEAERAAADWLASQSPQADTEGG